MGGWDIAGTLVLAACTLILYAACRWAMTEPSSDREDDREIHR